MYTVYVYRADWKMKPMTLPFTINNCQIYIKSISTMIKNIFCHVSFGRFQGQIQIQRPGGSRQALGLHRGGGALLRLLRQVVGEPNAAQGVLQAAMGCLPKMLRKCVFEKFSKLTHMCRGRMGTNLGYIYI